MDRFVITNQICNINFLKCINLDIIEPVEQQLNRRRLVSRVGRERGNVQDLRDVIDDTSSLKVSFGWKFKSQTQFEIMMQECIDEITPNYNMLAGSLVSDPELNWLGFMPFDVFDKMVYEDLGIYGLILFNNELVNYQIDVITFISRHKFYIQHSLLQNPDYRFKYFKLIRNDQVALLEAFHYYIDSVINVDDTMLITRRYIEETIGYHYLNYPEIFFELLEFYKLKGVIHE
jgi:hypothetical protein